MGATDQIDDYERVRKIHRVLVMHYVEGLSQAEIAKRTGISHPTVNRLVKEGHERGFVQISVKSPFQSLFELEQQLVEAGGLREAIVTPSVSELEEVNLTTAGKAAAEFLLANLRDGDTVCVSGGRGVSAVINALAPSRAYDVTVVPATGGVQGKHFTDVNHLAAQMANRLQGRAFQIHAPVFADTKQERDVIRSMHSVREVLARARDAAIAVVGIGSVISEISTYYSLRPSATGSADLSKTGAAGELVAHLLDRSGTLCDYELNERVVGLSLEEFRAIPLTVGISSGQRKAEPIASVLRGGFLDALATDEATAARVVDILKG
ncbi:sugar-binding transcriptional regulator [Mesorhizobium sp. LHD-90]|nr:sugar-binding transcriptional regulator [Mesorhizobium sp. LHD-90]MDQ6435421.1 sugar-binding transcriptional regulator [Mesorhizobium sp. LHD-90]